MQSSYFRCILFFIIGTTTFAQAQENTSSLSIKQIMQGEKFIGFSPDNIRWNPDGNHILFSWNPDNDTLRSQYKLDARSGDIHKMTPTELMSEPGRSVAYSKDRTRYAYNMDGDIYLKHVATGDVKRLTKSTDNKGRLQFSNDGERLIYVSRKNYYSINLNSGLLEQLSNFVASNKKKEENLSEHKQWLEDDQLAHFDILRERKEKRDIRQRRADLLESNQIKPIYVGKKNVRLMGISPDLRFITYSITKNRSTGRTIVADNVTQSGYARDLNGRDKVGHPQSTQVTWIYDMKKDTSYKVNLSDIPGIKQKPEFMKDYIENGEEWVDTFSKKRNVALLGPIYADDGKAVVVVRSMDNKDRWIMQLHEASGSLTLIDHQRDEAWIGGPGIVSWNFSGGNLGWIDNHTLYFQSEETGYSHLYSYNFKNKKKKALTKGNYEILSAALSHDKKTFFLTTNEVSPHEQHFYHMSTGGGKKTQITSVKGGHQVSISPDESHLAVRFSTSNTPWELYVMENKAGSEMKKMTSSTLAGYNSYEWRKPEIVKFKARDGVQVPARLYKPSPEKNNGAGVVFVHGAGYLQNVHEWWSGYYREYMFHNLLTDNGYTVIDIDYRASAGYGRDWRTAIYRWMGGHDLNDNVDGAKYLVSEHGVDPEKLGIYGGSYGGFITLMALFTSPETFECGAALRSVTDWAHYNHGYTSNILNTPVEDPQAYYKSSPIYHAENLQKHLIMLHGMVDTNVQFQDVVRLSQRLIELEKEDWELAVFPMEAHGFVEPSSWTDEYRRIFELFQKRLR